MHYIILFTACQYSKILLPTERILFRRGKYYDFEEHTIKTYIGDLIEEINRTSDKAYNISASI